MHCAVKVLPEQQQQQRLLLLPSVNMLLWTTVVLLASSAVMASAQLDLGCSLEVVVDPFFVDNVENELKLKE